VIRWVLTPVYASTGGALTGVLIAGDITNGKTIPCYKVIEVSASTHRCCTGATPAGLALPAPYPPCSTAPPVSVLRHVWRRPHPPGSDLGVSPPVWLVSSHGRGWGRGTRVCSRGRRTARSCGRAGWPTARTTSAD
jgi:hypothetical protein